MKSEHKIVWYSCGRTHVGGLRKINQDAFADFPDKCLWIVADGIGGHEDGGSASSEIIRTFQQFKPDKSIGMTTKNIYQQLVHVNNLLIKQAEMAGDNKIIGSTVVLLYASQQRCVVVWSGDSRVYLFRRGQLRQLTRDHNNESKLLAEGLSPEQIKDHPYAQILTHAIGGEPEVYLDAQVQEVVSGDVFLLCSDGLNKEISDSEIESILTQMTYQYALNYLMDLALKRGGRDNITIILAQAIRQND